MDDKRKNWFSVEVESEKAAEEAVEFALNELGSLGNEINTLGKQQIESLIVIGYFNERINDTIFRVKLDECLQIYGFSSDAALKIEWREIENQDWLAEWKKHWKPTETAGFVIAPMWSEVENTKKTIIRIEPSMAFGTGTHETTRLCLKAIEDNYKSGETFLDVGTGTGILAIAAAKIQNENPKAAVVGCDTDEASIRIAAENSAINDAKNIEFFAGSISVETPEFDFVCANLTADVIVPLVPLLLKKAKRILVLSGILREQESLVAGEISKFGVENLQIDFDGEWVSMLITK